MRLLKETNTEGMNNQNNRFLRLHCTTKENKRLKSQDQPLFIL